MEFRNLKNQKIATRHGAFITFEGTEGSGKSTQSRKLAQALRNQGYHVLETREPGGTPLAEQIRKLLLASSKTNKPSEPITPTCESMLIFAARSQHIAHVIKPALDKGMIVICDRFFDSTLAYQGYARGLGSTFLNRAQKFIAGGIQPHLTFFLDLPVKEGLTRRQQSAKQDRLDRETRAFHERVRRGFLALAKQEPNRIHRIDARQTPQALASIIGAITEQVIRQRKSRRLIRSPHSD